MSDTTWTPPEPGDPGTPRDVNRPEDVAWDGNEPEKYTGQTQEVPEPKKAAKKTASKSADSEAGN